MRILGIGPCPAEDKADADLINAGEQTVTILAAMRVFDCESAELASQLLRDICARQCISPGQMTLHSDNGAPMKGETMLATMQRLGVAHTRSRPAVSNDNPYG